MAPSTTLLVLAFSSVLLFSVVSVLAENNVTFSYGGDTGPENWGSLSPAYNVCSNGKSQSPIDIQKKSAVFNIKLQFRSEYTARNATLVNNGFNIGISYGDGGRVTNINGKSYTLEQTHWHTPSEHTIDGKRFAAELHLVHMATDGSHAVIGILYKYGKADPFLAQIKDSLDVLTRKTLGGDTKAQVPIILDISRLSRRSRKHFRYWGSLTVPPCSESISWTILGKVEEISKEQVQALKVPLESSFKNNCRPLQSLNDRKVEFYRRKVGILD